MRQFNILLRHCAQVHVNGNRKRKALWEMSSASGGTAREGNLLVADCCNGLKR